MNLRVDEGAAQTLCLWPLGNTAEQQENSHEAAFKGFHRASTPDVINKLS